MLKYKGYTAKVEYDPEDAILWGEVLNTADKILFEAEHTHEVEARFHEAVDDYLEMCEEIGKVPEKPYSGQFPLRMPPELHKEISTAAALARKSVNSFIIDILQHRAP